MVIMEGIIIKGARENNLKSLTLRIPLGKIIVVRGVSGAGKSSLAIDTLLSESQRRFFLSLSTFARQFFEKYKKPEYDSIENLPPAVSIEKRALIKNPRSTIATITDIYDFLRILFEKFSTLRCPECGKDIIEWNEFSLKEKLFKDFLNKSVFIGFKGKHTGEYYFRKGFQYALSEGKKVNVLSLDEASLMVIVDSVLINSEEEDRIFDSLKTSFQYGDDIFVYDIDGKALNLFSSKFKCPVCKIHYEKPDSSLFSFNSPKGACKVCKGFGDIIEIDMSKVIPDDSLSILDGAVEPFMKPAAKELFYELLNFCKSEGIPVDVPFKDLRNDEKDKIINGYKDYYGIKGFFSWLDTKKYKLHVRVYLSRYRKYEKCPSCKGTRLNEYARSFFLSEKNMGEVLSMSIFEFERWLLEVEKKFNTKAYESIFSEIKMRVKFLKDVGLSYLSLLRKTFTLSGGEAQRISLSSVLGAGLSDILVVLDEPTKGLHSKDKKTVSNSIIRLKENGNTVLIVDNSDEILSSADFVLELGPEGGEKGGKIVFFGEKSIYKKKKYSYKKIKKRKLNSFIEVYGAKKHNLKSINFKIPYEAITIITGVSGAGKTSLIYDVLYKGLVGEEKNFERIVFGGDFSKIIFCNSTPITKTPRATPITYLGLFSPIRKLYSRQKKALSLGLNEGSFSFLSKKGACPVCGGTGFIKIEMQFLSDIYVVCDECGGKRYKEKILEVRFKEKTIYDILNMSFSRAKNFFKEELYELSKKFEFIERFGLGYLKLGQPLSTLSSGENQRLKLLSYLIKEKLEDSLIILDEPSSGLHPEDELKIIKVLRDLIDKKGNTIVIVDHSPLFIEASDYIIELGPSGGEDGGYIIKEEFL